ncbi:DeoR/GlpR transcriptional regulator [Nakamurella silvestris]|nr:DeoR/GlpR transcriptional regulator [Nakamurella silvestris]
MRADTDVRADYSTIGGPMLATVRHATILEKLHRSGNVRVTSLTSSLGVSAMTIRRDLNDLAQQGLVIKVHGGALPIGTKPPGPAVELDRTEFEIAARAAELIQPGMSIGISSGTASEAIASRLGHIPDLTVVTNSMTVADILQASATADPQIILTGGIPTKSGALIGPVALSCVQSFNVDVAIVSVDGVDVRAGITGSDPWQAEITRGLVGVAQHVVVIADSSKWGRAGLSYLADLDQIDTWVTDADLGPDAGSARGSNIGEIIQVDAG